jgi:hypothetical protein
VKVPLRRVWPTAEASLASGAGNRVGRGVDSACRSRVIQPRNRGFVVGAFVVAITGAAPRTAYRPAVLGPAGVEAPGKSTRGPPRNLRESAVSNPKAAGAGLPDRKAPGSVPASGTRPPRTQARGLVAWPRTQAARYGCADVAASHSTADAGEPTPRDPAEGRGRLVKEPLEGNMPRTPSRDSMFTQRQRIAELARRALLHQRVRDGDSSVYRLAAKP